MLVSVTVWCVCVGRGIGRKEIKGGHKNSIFKVGDLCSVCLIKKMQETLTEALKVKRRVCFVWCLVREMRGCELTERGSSTY